VSKPSRRTQTEILELGLLSGHYAGDDVGIERRIIANIEGLEKTGKDTIALTGPDPIVLFNLDRGCDGPLQRARKKGKKIIVAGIDRGPGKLPAYYFTKPKLAPGKSAQEMSYIQATAEAARKVWRQFKDDYLEALDSKVRTLVIDTGTAAWELIRFARFGKLKQILPLNYSEVNQEFQSLIQRAYDFDKNVIWLHRIKPEWADTFDKKGNKVSVKTGRFERSGYRDMGFEVQTNVRLEKWTDKKGRVHFKAQILDCRLNQGLDGLELEDEMCSFPFLAATVFENDPDEWE
jgi:hypothetical protein